MEVIKVSGKTQEFKVEKIERAINLANKAVDLEQRMDEATIKKVINNVLKMLEGFNSVSVDDIHDMVERSLMKYPSHY
jgi:transcriptional regulator NrdR family protein